MILEPLHDPQDNLQIRLRESVDRIDHIIKKECIEIDVSESDLVSWREHVYACPSRANKIIARMMYKSREAARGPPLL